MAMPPLEDDRSIDAARAELAAQGPVLLVCPGCGRTFEPGPAGPTVPGLCPACGARLFVPGGEDSVAGSCSSATVGTLAPLLSPARDPASQSEPPTPRLRPAVEGSARTEPITPRAAGPAGGLRRTPETHSNRVGRYELLEELGAGGMGRVWRALDTSLQRVVALKQIRPEGLDREGHARFLREARLAARLRHPNIVPVLDADLTEQGVPYLVMEYVEGRTLAAWFAEARAAAPTLGSAARETANFRKPVELLASVAEAVGYAHSQGIIHRDLKPSNVLLDAQERPFVADFGLAKQIGVPAGAGPHAPRAAPDSATEITAVGQVLGTPAYMSPEQADTSEARPITTRSDVWSLGVILYEALTGLQPFQAETPVLTLLAVQHREPPSPRRLQPRLPLDLETLCQKSMEREPARRYADAAALARDLRRWLAGEPIEASRPSRAERAWRWGARRRRVLLPAALAAAAVVAALGWGWRERSARDTLDRAILEDFVTPVEGFEHSIMTVRMSGEARRLLAAAPLALLDRLIAARPELGPPYAWRGRVKALLGDGTAEADLDRACALSPAEWRVWRLRAEFHLGRFLRARPLPSPELSQSRLVPRPFPKESAEETAAKEAALRDLREMDARLSSGSAGGEGPDGAATVRLRLARAMLALWSDREDAPRHALDLLEGAAGPEAWRVRGIALFQAGRFDESVEALGKALAEWPQDALGWRYRGLARIGAEVAPRPAAGGAAPGSHVTVTPAERVRRLRDALADFDEALRCEPTPGPFLNSRAIACAFLGRALEDAGLDPRDAYRAGVEAASRGIGGGSASSSEYLTRACCRAALATAESDRGRDPHALLAQALSDCDEALRVAGKDGVATVHVQRGNVRLSLAKAEAAAGRPHPDADRAALTEFEEVLRSDPGCTAALAGSAAALELLAQAEPARGEDARASCRRALECWDETLRRDPAFPLGNAGRASVRQRLAELDGAAGHDPSEGLRRAIEEYGEALTREPGAVLVNHNRANAWRALGEASAARGLDPRACYRNAIADYDEVVRRKPDLANGVQSRGHARVLLGLAESTRAGDAAGCYRDAIADYAEASRLRPADAGAHASRGAALLLLARTTRGPEGEDPKVLAKGLAALDEALRLDPGAPIARENRASGRVRLARVLAARGEDPRALLRSALEDYDAGIARRPAPAQWYADRGSAARALAEARAQRGEDPREENRRAEADYREAILRGFAPARLSLGLLLSGLGRYEAAVEAFEEAAKALPARAASTTPRLTELRRRLAALGKSWEEELRLAALLLRAGDAAAALPRYAAGFALLEAEAAALPEAKRAERLADPRVREVLSAARYELACVECLVAASPGADLPAAARDRAFGHLQEAVRLGFHDRDRPHSDPRLAPLRSDARFDALLPGSR
ncbi:MAG: protein kinase [Planctomycetes bacterium]|nr:protein kinase [Planctomycetota bacterium]